MKVNCLLFTWIGIGEGELFFLLFTWIGIDEGELFAVYLDWD